MKKTILFLLALGMFAVSCKKDEEETPVKPNPQPSQDLTYISNTFKSIKIIHDNLKADAAQTPDQLLEMYKKDIKPNVAANTTADFEAWIPVIKENADMTASEGQSGLLGKRFLNAKGVEVSQLVKKGFIGAFQMNGYNYALMSGVGADTKEKREAALDKAVTFLLGEKSYLDKEPDADGNYPVYDGNQFVHYMNKVGMGTPIYTAIKDAYAKVDNENAFKGALLSINALVTKTVAMRAVHYLKKAAELQGGFDEEVAHEISEGFGFCYSLQFAYVGHGSFYLTHEQAIAFTEYNLWDVENVPAALEAKGREIAEAFGFDYDDAK